MEENSPKKEDYGVIKIADDVIATIAGLAAMEVEGVAGMAGGVTSGITEMLGKKNMTKGVKLDVNDKDVAVDLYLVERFGVKIPALAHDIQNKVKQAIETMTGLKTREVNVHVQGVTFGTKDKDVLEAESRTEQQI